MMNLDLLHRPSLVALILLHRLRTQLKFLEESGYGRKNGKKGKTNKKKFLLLFAIFASPSFPSRIASNVTGFMTSRGLLTVGIKAVQGHDGRELQQTVKLVNG